LAQVYLCSVGLIFYIFTMSGLYEESSPDGWKIFEESSTTAIWPLFSEKKFRNAVAFADRWYSMYANAVEIASMGVAFSTFLVATLFVGTHIEMLDFSSVLTLGGGLQCLGFTLLNLLVRSRESVSGVSGKSLQLYVLVFLFRLTSTLNKNGYIPMDKTGDWLFQLADISSLLIVLQLLRRVYRANNETYQESLDTLPIAPLIPFALAFSAFTYGDLNADAFFDYVWMVGCTLDTVAMLPQLFLLSRVGGKVEGLASHFVACIFASRACTFSFWFYGYPEVAPLDGGFNHCGYAIIVLHLAQLIMSGDFMYYYLKSVQSGQAMVLPELDV